MPVTDADGQREEVVFSQTFYGDFSLQTAAPQLGAVSVFKDGFATALQYMVEGDQWMVYIPQNLFYGSDGLGTVLPYSTVRMFLHLNAIYPPGTTIPVWR